tara:strand:- start:663 stop:1415 length:753 start_codon:yes stop_codon:yes gene_type:complete
MIKTDNSLNGISQWFLSDDAKNLIFLETNAATDLISDVFGYHVVQLGDYYPTKIMALSRIQHKILAGLSGTIRSPSDLSCDVEALPFAEGTVDLMVLPHLLEFGRDPSMILREAERVLIGEGHLVVFGFNPWSFFGLTSVFKRWQDIAPWNCKFISAPRLKDWLHVLGFETLIISRFGYGSLKGEGWNGVTGNGEKLMKYLFPRLGNTYCLVAKKKIEGLKAVRAKWTKTREILESGLAKPSVSCTGVET